MFTYIPGSLRLITCGSGHNGVRSVIASLKTDAFRRIRIGIDRPPTKEEVTDYVLSKFNDSELSRLTTDVYPSYHRLLLQMIAQTETFVDT